MCRFSAEQRLKQVPYEANAIHAVCRWSNGEMRDIQQVGSSCERGKGGEGAGLCEHDHLLLVRDVAFHVSLGSAAIERVRRERLHARLPNIACDTIPPSPSTHSIDHISEHALDLVAINLDALYAERGGKRGDAHAAGLVRGHPRTLEQDAHTSFPCALDGQVRPQADEAGLRPLERGVVRLDIPAPDGVHERLVRIVQAWMPDQQ